MAAPASTEKFDALVKKITASLNDETVSLKAQVKELCESVRLLTEKQAEMGVMLAASIAEKTTSGRKTAGATNGEKVPKAAKAADNANKLPSNNQQFAIKLYATEQAERAKIIADIKTSHGEAGVTITDEDIQKIFSEAKAVTSKQADTQERYRAEMNLLWKDKGVKDVRGPLITEKMRTGFRTRLNRLKDEAASAGAEVQLKSDNTGADAEASAATPAAAPVPETPISW